MQTLTLRIFSIFFLLLPVSFTVKASQAESGRGYEMKSGMELYVSPTGNDDNDGTFQKPWKTIIKAQNFIRELNKANRLPAKGVTVWLRQGRYEVAPSLQFNSSDNGESGKPVIYSAYAGEQVSVFNGKIIDPKLWKPLGTEARSRLHPRVKPEQILELDLSPMNVKNSSVFPDKFINWTLFDFFSDDVRQPVSQWPNLDENIRGVNDPGWTTCNGSKDVVSFYFGEGGKPTDGDGTNELDADGTNRSERWQKSLSEGHKIWLKGFWRIPWEAYTTKIAEINTNEKWIRMAVNANQGMGSKYSPPADAENTYRVGDGKEKWCAVNLPDEIDRPGEWAYDFKDKKLYFYPSQNLKKVITYIADRNEPVISLNGAKYLQFIGLTIEGGQGNGIGLKNSSDILIAGCNIRNVGASGIWEDGGQNNTFQSNNIFETGGTGITIQNTGDRAKLIPSNDKVLNNYIHNTGKLTYLYAMFIKNSVGITFANNLMHDIPAGGFSTLLINDCIFEYNEIHNIALKVSDMGGYYGYGGWTCYGNEIRYNFIHHSNRANGLYSDDGTSGKIFYNNIVQGTIKPFLFGGGHHNIGRNNLLVDCESSGSVDDRGIARKYFISNNFGKAVRDMKPDSEPWKSYGQNLMKKYNFPASDSLWKSVMDTLWHPEYPNGSKLYDNVEVHSKGFSKPKNGTVSIYDNTTIKSIVEAGFKDYKNMDLRTENAEILKKFPELNTIFPKMGLQTDAYRKRVPSRQETGGLEHRSSAGNKAYEDAVNR